MSEFEWHDIKGKSLFDLWPPDVDSGEWRRYREAFHRAERLEDIGHPIQLDVELNGGCNMACPFCTHGYEKVKDVQMHLGDYHSLILEAVELGVRSVKLNYINEPMLRRDLEDIIAWTREVGILNVYFVTNGSALTPRRAARLVDSGLTKLFVSIDATTPETYNAQRKSGLFDRVRENVRGFIAYRDSVGAKFPLVIVSFLINQINHHERDAFEAYWTGLADIVNFQRMNEVPDRETGLVIDHSQDAVEACKFPFKQLVVTHRGVILPCCKLSGQKLPIGHIADTTLSEAWARSEALRRIHEENRGLDHPVCGPCMRCES